MSGICGICEPGRTLSSAGIKAMLAAFVLPEESALQTPGSDSVSLAVARRCRARGVSFVELLDGVFSFALWDEERRRLVLAIDRLGVNSLYWRKEGDRILFASRVGAIRGTQEAPAAVNPAALVQYMLFSAVPAPMAIYQGIEKLRPGTCLVFEAGQIRQTRYWDLQYRESDTRNVAHWAHEVREGMRSAVH